MQNFRSIQLFQNITSSLCPIEKAIINDYLSSYFLKKISFCFMNVGKPKHKYIKPSYIYVNTNHQQRQLNNYNQAANLFGWTPIKGKKPIKDKELLDFGERLSFLTDDQNEHIRDLFDQMKEYVKFYEDMNKAGYDENTSYRSMLSTRNNNKPIPRIPIKEKVDEPTYITNLRRTKNIHQKYRPSIQVSSFPDSSDSDSD